MNNIGILVGEDADLPKDKIQNLPISTFPFVVNWKGYAAMRASENKEFPKTSQPSIQTFKDLLNDNLKKYQELLVITISSSLSGTYNSAVQATKQLLKNEQKRVHIIDSKTSTGGEGLLVLRAASLIRSKININKIIEEIRQSISKTHLLGVFDDPMWLQKGGRISSIQSFVIKNMLKAGFRPILTIKDGKIVTKKIQREKDKAEALSSHFYSDTWKVSPQKVSVAITHADCEKDANKLKDLLAKFGKNITIEYINTISAVVGSHLGPDSLIISWMV